MSIEWLIVFYMAICIMMIGYNACFLVIERFRNRRHARISAYFARQVSSMVSSEGEGLSPASRDVLLRSLSSLSGMEAFDGAMERALAECGDVLESYLVVASGAFEWLARRSDERPDLDRAYFAYLIRRWYRAPRPAESIVYCLQRDLLADSLYLRQNAFEALAAIAPAGVVSQAVSCLDSLEGGYSPRLVTETLLSFSGDAADLAAELDACLETLTAQTQAAVVNYLRMVGLGSSEHLLEMMGDASVDREVRLACVRYFMRNPYPEARDAVMRLARLDDPVNWEYSAVASMALSSYPGAETVEVLKGLLSSGVWFVRFNAAKSLFDLGCTLEGELADILSGPDRFAREMLVYRWQLEESAKGGVR